MPAGEQGPRNPPQARSATRNGGTSGAEDTTRTAGYVADLSSPKAVPPGAPLPPERSATGHPSEDDAAMRTSAKKARGDARRAEAATAPQRPPARGGAKGR